MFEPGGGWNQLPADWLRLLELEPEGCFGLEVSGRVVATTTAVCFGTRLAWIGMVLTAPGHRRRGHGRALMEHALGWLERRRVEWIKLDATEMGRPLYEKLGFAVEGAIERWSGVGRPAVGNQLPRYTSNRELDRASFGADRGLLLASLARDESAAIGSEGFAMGRPGATAASFGPCVARSPEAARQLAKWFLNHHLGETVYWDLLPANRAAVRLARELGCVCRRKLVRMGRPGVAGTRPPVFDNSLVYATAGFEYG